MSRKVKSTVPVLKNSNISRLTILQRTTKNTFLCFSNQADNCARKNGQGFLPWLTYFYELIYSGIKIGEAFMISTKF
jgi:hypothetical protein